LFVSTASIHAMAEGETVLADARVWAAFSSPGNQGEFYRSWLAILCAEIGQVSAAMLLLGADEAGSFAAAAVWPDANRNMQFLAPAAEQALNERRGIVVAPAGGPGGMHGHRAHVAYPIELAGKLCGAVVLDVGTSTEVELQKVLRQIHWASAWLVDNFRQEALLERDERLARLSLAADLVATAVQERHSTASALAVVNELAARLACDRVSLGLEKSGSIEVIAISHTATFDPKSNLVRLIGGAMDEVLDLDVPIIHPQQDEDDLGAIAHDELAREVKDVAVCSVPLVCDNHTMGVVSLERSSGEAFDSATQALAKTLGLLLGPILQLKQESERPVVSRAHESLKQGVFALFGPNHPGVKLIALLVMALLIFFSFANGEYRVSAKTVIEGAIQRAVVAPFDGYVEESSARAGDTVTKGQVLSRLDEKDLRLEQAKLESEREQSSRKYRQALAEADRASMAVIAAQVDQAEAQLSLVEEKLARATLTAPFDGIVVSGDLSQLLGSPVDQGKVLFEVAPLDAYRVILKVDERDIAHLATGQEGDLALSGIPNEVMHFVVKQITPVSTAQEGINYFRVEAQIDHPSPRLRPGMEGIGKVSIGERKLIWIWTHSLTDWLRLKVWNWTV
jgi:RND family efflux transporter MFP subunit